MSHIPTKDEVRRDVNLLFRNAPGKPISKKPVEVCVVGRRCVYLADHRIAGGKAYISENLPQHTLTTSLDEILNAFSEADVLAALSERKDYRDYLTAYHAQPDDTSQTGGAS